MGQLQQHQSIVKTVSISTSELLVTAPALWTIGVLSSFSLIKVRVIASTDAGQLAE